MVHRLWKWVCPAIVGLALVLTTACQSSAPSQPAASSPPPVEQKVDLVVYTALEDDEISVYLPDFQKKHPGIEVKLIRDSTGIITAKLLAEKDNPIADVVWGTAVTSLLLCDQSGMFAGYNPKGIERIKARFKDAKNTEPHWVGIKAWMAGFVGNTIEMKAKGLPMPTAWKDLIDPSYKGALAAPHPASSGTGFLFVSGILQSMGEDNGWAYLDKLHANIAMYTHSGSEPAKLAGRGEYPLGISIANRGLKQKAKGEPLEVTFPKEGSGWDLEANALMKKPRVKQAARDFLDWAISDDAMRMYAEVYPIIAADLNLPMPEGYPADPMKQLIHNDFDWAAANRDRILSEWSSRFEGKSAPQ